MGSKRSNMSNVQRKILTDAGAGRGTVGKTPVAGAKDRATNQVTAEVVPSKAKPVLQAFVDSHIGGRSHRVHRGSVGVR